MYIYIYYKYMCKSNEHTLNKNRYVIDYVIFNHTIHLQLELHHIYPTQNKQQLSLSVVALQKNAKELPPKTKCWSPSGRDTALSSQLADHLTTHVI